MASCKGLMLWFLIILLLFMAFFVLSFCPKISVSKEASNKAHTSTQKSGSNRESGIGALAAENAVNNSAREVPTGPDPLHHHNNPTVP